MAARPFPIRLAVEGDQEAKAKFQAVIAVATGLQQQFQETSRAARSADIAAYGAELDRLRAKYSPLFSAQQQYRATLAEINTALKAGALSQAEYGAAMARTKDAFARQVTAIRGSAVAGAQGMARFGTSIQQAGFQVGDFAVQVASGTNPLRAFIQQGTQLVSMFGPWGAVIGAAGAVVGALATAFLDLEGATDGARSAQERYAEAQETANRLMEETGRLSEVKRKSLEAEKQQLLDNARTELVAANAAVQAQIARHEALAGTTVRAPRENIGELNRLRAAAHDAQVQLSIVNAELGRYGDGRSRIAETTDRIARGLKDAGAAAAGAEKSVRSFDDVLADLNETAGKNATKDYADAVKLLERTIESGLTDQQRYERQVEELNRALELAASRGYRLSIEAQEALNRAMRDADPAARAAQEAYEKQRQERERMAEQAAEDMRRPFVQAAEGIQDALADTFKDVFDNGISSFSDLGRRVVDIMKAAAAEIAAAMVFQPVISPTVQSRGLAAFREEQA